MNINKPPKGTTATPPPEEKGSVSAEGTTNKELSPGWISAVREKLWTNPHGDKYRKVEDAELKDVYGISLEDLARLMNTEFTPSTPGYHEYEAVRNLLFARILRGVQTRAEFAETLGGIKPYQFMYQDPYNRVTGAAFSRTYYLKPENFDREYQKFLLEKKVKGF